MLQTTVRLAGLETRSNSRRKLAEVLHAVPDHTRHRNDIARQRERSMSTTRDAAAVIPARPMRYRKPRSAHTIVQYFIICAYLQVEENCKGPFDDFLGGNQGSHQEKTRLHPTPTGPGRCPAVPICVVSIAITYYEVNLPLMTCSQHTQYFL